MNRKTFYAPLIAAMTALFTVALGAVAIADVVQSDADFVTSGNQAIKDLGTVSAGATLSPQVTFQLACSGNKHVDQGQTVTLARASATLDGGAVGTSIVDASTSTIGAIPAAWPDDGVNCPTPDPAAVQDNGNSTVTIHVPMASGPHTVTVTYTQSLSPAGGNDPASITGGNPVITFTITVGGDSTPPVIAPHADVTAEATSAAGAIVNYTSPGTTDDIDAPGTATCAPASGTQFALGDTTVTCNAADIAGNPATPTTFAVHVLDTTAPVIASHTDVTAEATSSAGAIVTYSSPGTSDAVDGAGTATCSPASGSRFALGDTTVTCNATDAAGNGATPTMFVVHVVDTTAPVISVTDVTAEATGPSGAAVTYTASASDTVDGSVPVACTPASGSTFALGTTTVDCSATDIAGNTGSASFNVTVEDTTSPVLVLPADVTAEATGPGGATVDFTASASDIVDGVVPATCSPASGSTFPLGATAVDCSAEDGSANTASGSFDVTVVDTTPPDLTLPADMIVEAMGPDGAPVDFTASASDLVDGGVPVTCGPASGSTFPLGTTTVNCSAEDSHGNTAKGSVDVTVVDTTPPVIDPHDSETAEATGPDGAVVSYASPATSDIVDGPGTATCDPASGSTFALGDTTVACNATDAAGNHAAATTVVVHVVDTTPPVIDPHADVTREATSSAGAIVNYVSPAWSDIVDGTGTATCAPAPGSQFALGDTTVTCTALDAAGNDATETTFVVLVVDTTAPVIDPHADITVTATGASGAVANYTSPASSDAVDGPGAATCTPASGSTFPIGPTTVTCNATDAAGNHATPTTFTVTVVYSWAEFFKPVDNLPMWNSVKSGSAIPVKFSLGGNMGLNVMAAGYPRSQVIACDSSATVDGIEETVTAGGSGLTYDPTANQYIYIWKTDKAWAGTCRQLVVQLADGSFHRANFKLLR